MEFTLQTTVLTTMVFYGYGWIGEIRQLRGLYSLYAKGKDGIWVWLADVANIPDCLSRLESFIRA